MDAEQDQNAEELAELLASEWHTLFARLKLKGFSESQAMRLVNSYVLSSSMPEPIVEESDD